MHSGKYAAQDAADRPPGFLSPEKIRSIRKKHGMSGLRFEEVTGLGRATLARWEHGRPVLTQSNDRYMRLAGDANMELLMRETCKGEPVGAAAEIVEEVVDRAQDRHAFSLRPISMTQTQRAELTGLGVATLSL